MRESFSLVAVALLCSSFVFVLGLATREPDVIYLAWLDQGSNLLLVEAEGSAASLLTTTGTVVVVLLCADLTHLIQLFGRLRFNGSARLFWKEFSRLTLVGAASGLLAIVSFTLSPILSISSEQVLLVTILAIGALAAIFVAGTLERG